MTLYIIDEEQLLDTKSYIYHEDEVAFERIYRVVLSHPYNPQYQCGDDCKGECSGEVDGFVHCPYTPQAARDAKELFRDEIAKWKDEDPLFMAYVYGQKAGRKEEREKVLEKFVAFRMIANVKIEDETEGNYYTSVNAWREFELLLEELRQSKDGE
jgi:hypothetical protein